MATPNAGNSGAETGVSWGAPVCELELVLSVQVSVQLGVLEMVLEEESCGFQVSLELGALDVVVSVHIRDVELWEELDAIELVLSVQVWVEVSLDVWEEKRAVVLGPALSEVWDELCDQLNVVELPVQA
jgi:hypothetical protein